MNRKLRFVRSLLILTQQACWAEEFSGVDFGDRRLSERLSKVAQAIFSRPEQSMYQRFETWADAKAAYNFFANSRVTGKEITAAHTRATRERIKRYDGTVLAIGDSMVLGLSHYPSIEGLGSVGRRGRSQEQNAQGLWLHHVFCVDEAGEPLGLLAQRVWARPEDVSDGRGHHTRLPIGQKESKKWLGCLRACASDQELAAKLVSVYDREADIYEVFAEAERLGGRYVVRLNHNRIVNKKSRTSKTGGDRLKDLVAAQMPLGAAKIEVNCGKNHDKKRFAVVEVRTVSFTLTAPPRRTSLRDDHLEPVKITVVAVTETGQPPEGDSPVDWTLLTNTTSGTSLDEALRCTKWYSLRWQIEVFHRVMKTGFRLDETRLSSASRLFPLIALVSVVAWRTMSITMIGRTRAEAPAEEVVDAHERKVLSAMLARIRNKEVRIETARDVTRGIASLGGFKGRAGDGDPGAQVIWRGWMRLLEAISIVDTIAKPPGTYG